MYKAINICNRQKSSGFTLIEIIVSLALFSVVITIAVGALLVLIASNRQLQNEQSVLSNLSFALDSMTREIRTGSNYYCSFGSSFNPGNLGQSINCQSAGGDVDFHGIAFDEGGRSVTQSATDSRISYFFDRNDGKLYRQLSGRLPQSIVSDGIFIANAQFFVTGATRVDTLQPRITIVIEAYNSRADADADAATRERAYVIQTTVTQRTLDI